MCSKESYVWVGLYGPEEAFWNKSFEMRCRASELKAHCSRTMSATGPKANRDTSAFGPLFGVRHVKRAAGVAPQTSSQPIKRERLVEAG
jgi:hypothetical protein